LTCKKVTEESGSEIVPSTDQDIVRFDVCMHNPLRSEEVQRLKELKTISSNGRYVEANILAEALQDLPEVHAVPMCK
jgi:hypothetical protein